MVATWPVDSTTRRTVGPSVTNRLPWPSVVVVVTLKKRAAPPTASRLPADGTEPTTVVTSAVAVSTARTTEVARSATRTLSAKSNNRS